jgi:hypothetical protein
MSKSRTSSASASPSRDYGLTICRRLTTNIRRLTQVDPADRSSRLHFTRNRSNEIDEIPRAGTNARGINRVAPPLRTSNSQPVLGGLAGRPSSEVRVLPVN